MRQFVDYNNDDNIVTLSASITGINLDELAYHLAFKDFTESLDGHKIKRVIYNDPATIIYWLDGRKTVVKVESKDTYSPTIGFLYGCLKHFLTKQEYSKLLTFMENFVKNEAEKDFLMKVLKWKTPAYYNYLISFIQSK